MNNNSEQIFMTRENGEIYLSVKIVTGDFKHEKVDRFKKRKRPMLYDFYNMILWQIISRFM